MQIRAEEVSKTQYVLEMKFSAQGLDKKVGGLSALQIYLGFIQDLVVGEYTDEMLIDILSV